MDLIEKMKNLEFLETYEGDDRYKRILIIGGLIELALLSADREYLIEMFGGTIFYDGDVIDQCVEDAKSVVRLHDSIKNDDEYCSNEIVERSVDLRVAVASYLADINLDDINTCIDGSVGDQKMIH